MTVISTVNLGMRIKANLLFILAVLILLTFGVGGNEWGTGFWLSVPFFVWSSWTKFKADHTAVIVETRDVR